MPVLKPQERQQQILFFLKTKGGPVTGTELASRLGVTRQIIVQDIAILRAAGESIIATPQGYLLFTGTNAEKKQVVVTLACQHTPQETGEELSIIVGLGGNVLDVIVEHPLYGELRGALMLKTHEDVQSFLSKLKKTGAPLLSTLANGVHLHTVEAPDYQTANAIRQKLSQKGYLLPER